MTCSQHVFLHLIICWNFQHVFVTCWRVRSCSTEVSRKKASMDPLRISIKLQWTHEFSSNSRIFSGQYIRILFNFLGESMHFLWIFPCSCRASMHFLLDFPRFCQGIPAIICGFFGNPCNFLWIFPGLSMEPMQFSVFFSQVFLWISQVFPGNPCIFVEFSQVFLRARFF